MPRYFLGVDVGATKTHALIADENGDVCGFGVSGAGNPEGVGYDGLQRVIAESTEQALEEAGISIDVIAGAGFGIGGYDWPCQDPSIRGAIEPLGLSAPWHFVNDALIALIAGASQGWGVAVIAGTSCNCWGRTPDRRIGRMTGFSWLGEAAGSAELVLKALQAVAAAWTCRGPETRLTEAFLRYTGLPDVERFLEAITLGRIHVGPEAAPIVFRVAEEGDPVAQELIRWAGRSLGDLALGVIRQLDLSAQAFEIVLAGSFFKGSPVVASVLEETVKEEAPAATIVSLQAPPVVGGVLLGMEQAGLDPGPIRRRLIASAHDRLA